MTDAQFAAWLSDPSAIRLILVEAVANVSGTETTFYMSTFGYVTQPTDTPANTAYLPIISTGLQYTEQIQLNVSTSLTTASSTGSTSSSGMTGGDIEIYNEDRSRDVWLSYTWVNRPIKAYIGDAKWNGVSSSYTRADFRLIFNGVMTDIGSQQRDKLNLIMSDKTQLLNVNVNAALLGGSTANANVAIPLCFGECFNVSPLLIDPVALTYQVHNGAIENIIEIRDNGVPIYNSTITGGATVNLAVGTFTLTQQPAGTITASVQGDKPSGTYNNTIATIIQQLVKRYGIPGTLFTNSDLDLTQLSAFDTAHSQPVGVYLTGGENLLTICQNLAASVGAQIIMSRAGLLQLIQITFPVPGTITYVDNTHMLQHTLEITDRSTVTASMMLGYCQNWTVQQNLVTAIPARDIDFFATQFLTKTQVDSTTETLFKLPIYPIEQDTYLLKGSDASAEALRQLNVFKVPRTTYQFEGTVDLMNLVLGQPLNMTHADFGMQSGLTGMIVLLAPNWITGRVTVGFMV